MDKLLRRKRYILIFVGPAFLIYLLFGLAPIVYNLFLSFYETNLLENGQFVGFKNYLKLFSDQFFINALLNNIKFVTGCYIAHMGLALVFSNILFQKMKGAKFFQSIYFMPSVICGTAIGLLWKFIYHPEFGLLNGILSILGLQGLAHNWLAEQETVIPALIVVTMWQYVGYHMVIQLAAMRNIDTSLFEAASIDGANGWQQFIKLNLPLIKPVLAIDSVLIITGSLKLYDLIAVTTAGGPNHASEVLATYMFYQGFKTLKFGYSSSIATVLLILCIAASLLTKFVFNNRKEV